MKKFASVVVVVLVLVGAGWFYLFHGYSAGKRWVWVQYKLGRASSASGVMVGKDGSLYTTGSQDDRDDYRGQANPGDKLDRLKATLTKRNDIVKSMGGRFLDVIPPISETIYNDYLPAAYRKVGDHRRATMAIDFMKGTGVDMLYLAPALDATKDRCRVFYRYETHWNWCGSYMGSQAVIAYLSQYYPAMKSTLTRISDYKLLDGPPVMNMWNNGQNFGNHLGITLLEQDPRPIPISGWSAKMTSQSYGVYRGDVFTKDDNSLPSLVMFGDSFMSGVRWVMAENFRRSVFVNPWRLKPGPVLPSDFDDFPVEVLQAEKPDIVIYERWERAMLLSPEE